MLPDHFNENSTIFRVQYQIKPNSYQQNNKIMGKNLHFVYSANSSSKGEVTLKKGGSETKMLPDHFNENRAFVKVDIHACSLCHVINPLTIQPYNNQTAPIGLYQLWSIKLYLSVFYFANFLRNKPILHISQNRKP